MFIQKIIHWVLFFTITIYSWELWEFNKNLKELERITETKIYSRGNSILVKSDPKKNDLIKNAIQFLTNQFLNNGNIEKKDIISSLNKFMIDEKLNLRVA